MVIVQGLEQEAVVGLLVFSRRPSTLAESEEHR